MQEKIFWNLLCYQMDCAQVHESLQKLTKPPIAYLQVGGVEVARCVDDIIVTGDTYEERLIGTTKTIKLFLKLGFIIQPEKNCLQLSKEIAY